jgi:hypothetical protein
LVRNFCEVFFRRRLFFEDEESVNTSFVGWKYDYAVANTLTGAKHAARMPQIGHSEFNTESGDIDDIRDENSKS